VVDRSYRTALGTAFYDRSEELGRRLGRLLKLSGEEIDIYRAPAIRITPEALPLCLASRRGLEKYVGREVEKLVEGPLRFDV